MPLYRRQAELDFELTDLDPTRPPTRVLMADPRDFDVLYAINPHMRTETGELKRVDGDAARRQWEGVRRAFADLGFPVDVLDPLAGHPDLVFCANQLLPLPSAGADWRRCVPSRMATLERGAEVAHVVAGLASSGFRIEPELPHGERMEGMGDALWHPGRRLLWGGIGPRSSAGAYAALAQRYDLPVVLVELVDPDFYHLDTCLAPLDESTCLWIPAAFDSAGRALVECLFPRALVVPEDEGRRLLACNACCPDGRHVLLQRGSTGTRERLEAAGFVAIELETGEFLKAGGSVFCMKLLYGSD